MTHPHPTLTRFALLAGGVAALAVVPLANPLLLGLGLILAGVLAAERCAAEVLPAGLDAGRARPDAVIFRHVL